MPPIPSTSHCKFYGACLCIHTRKTLPLAPIHLFTKQILLNSLYQESLTRILLQSVSPLPLMQLINHFLPLNIFCMHPFFLFLSTFLSHTFSWACRSLHNQKYFFKLSFYAFTWFSNNSSILDQTCISIFPMYPLPVILFSV